MSGNTNTKIGKIVEQATLLANDTMSGDTKDIVEYTISKYYRVCQSSAGNRLPKLTDISDATVKDLVAIDVDVEFAKYAVTRATNIIAAATDIVQHGFGYQEAVVEIRHKRNVAQKRRFWNLAKKKAVSP